MANDLKIAIGAVEPPSGAASGNQIKLAIGAVQPTADSTAPVLSATSVVAGSRPVELDVSFTPDEPCDYDIYISTNATELETTVASNAAKSGSATATPTTVTDVYGARPGTAVYAHVRAEDGSANVSVTSIGPITTTAYSASATLDGLTTPANSALMLFGGDISDQHDGGNGADHLDDSSANFGAVNSLLAEGASTNVLRNTSTGSESTVRVNTATSINDDAVGLGDITAGTDNLFDNFEQFEVVAGLNGDVVQSGDKIYVKSPVTVTSEAVQYDFYLEDVSTSEFGQGYTINDTAPGADDGDYDVSVSVKGQITLSPVAEPSAGEGLVTGLTSGLTSSLTSSLGN